MKFNLLNGLSIGLLTLILSTTGLPAREYREYSHPIPADADVLYRLGRGVIKALPVRFRVLVWNLHKGSNDSFTTDFMDLEDGKDLLMTQEMLLNSRMKMVFRTNPLNAYSTATSFFMGRDMDRTGVATGSMVEPSDLAFQRTDTLEPVINSPKVTLISRYPLTGTSKLLTVVNIHGINFVDNAAYKKEMGRLSDMLSKYPPPMIFAGDFNSWNDERNEILKEVTKKLNLKEAFFSPDNRMRFNKHPLDHFFYTQDLSVLNAKVEDYYQGSDHRPLELEVQYSNQLNVK